MAEHVQESLDHGEEHLEALEEAAPVVGLAAEAEDDRLAAPGCRPGLRAKISAR